MFYPVFLSRMLCVIAVDATTFRLYHVTLSCSTSSSAFTAFPLQYLIQWILLHETQRDLANFIARNTARSCQLQKLHNTLYTQDACPLSIQTYHYHNNDSRSQNDSKETKTPTGNRTLLTHYVISHFTF